MSMTNIEIRNTFIQTQSIDPSGLREERIELTCLESNTDLKSIVDYILPDGDRVGALLLNVGSDRQKDFWLRFFWEFEGIAPDLDETEASESIATLAALFESLPDGENLRVEFQVFRDYERRYEELYELFERAAPTSQYLIAEEIKHLQDADARLERRNHRIIISATYGGFQTARRSRLTRIFSRQKKKNIDDLLFDGIERGYRAWSELLGSQLPGRMLPLTGEQVWQHCWEQFNRFNDRALELQPEPSPQMLYVDLRDRTIVDCVRNALHPVTVMMRYPSAVPAANRDFIGVDGMFVGAMSAISLPGGFDCDRCSSRERLRYLWEAIDLPEAGDCRFVLEVSKAHKNQQVADFGLCVFVYRDNLDRLRQDRQKIASYFLSPVQMNVEVDVVDSIWISSLPFQALLMFQNDCSNRRNRQTPEYIAIFSPVSKIPNLHERGIEFIASDGRTPFYLDIWDRPGNLAIWGNDREEKQLLASYILHLTLSRGQFATVIDLATDRINAFGTFTTNLGGLSVNICEDAINIFETPEISLELEEKVRQTLRNEYIGVLLQTLETLVMSAPGSLPPLDRELVLPILDLALDVFFQDAEILGRYRLARSAGMGAQEWEVYPVLSDYLNFISLDLFDAEDLTDARIETILAIRIHLQQWIDGPYGRAIDSPSSVYSNAELMTLAASDLRDDEAIGIGALASATAIRRAITNAKQGSVLFHNETDISRSAVNSPHFSYLLVNAWKSNLRIMFAEPDPLNVFGGNGIGSEYISYHAIGKNSQSSDFRDSQPININPELEDCKDGYSSQWSIESKLDDFQVLGRIHFPISLIDLSDFKQDLDKFKSIDNDSDDLTEDSFDLLPEARYERTHYDSEDDNLFAEIARELEEFGRENFDK